MKVTVVLCAISDVITHKNHTQKTCLVLDILAEGEGFESASLAAQRFSSSSEFVLSCPSDVILYHLVLVASRLQVYLHLDNNT